MKLNGTFLKNDYDEAESFISSTIVRKDESLVTTISLEGQVIKLLPFLKRLKVDDSLLYTLNAKLSDVSSNIINHDVRRNFKTIGLTKRINLNGLF